jgi:hypothetical protein
MRDEGGEASGLLPTSYCEDLQANHLGTKMYLMLNGQDFVDMAARFPILLE